MRRTHLIKQIFSVVKSLSPRALVVDCREAEEFKVSRLPGAFNVPFSQFKMDLAQSGAQEGEMKSTNLLVNTLETEMKRHLGRNPSHEDELDVVCYCSVGYRSSVVAERILQLRENGLVPPGIQPYNLRGSIFQWGSEGRDLIRSEQSIDGNLHSETKVSIVHPYYRLWGSLALPFSLWQWD